MSKSTWCILALGLAAPLSTRAEAPKLTVYGILDVAVAYQNRTSTTGTNDVGEQLGVVAGTVYPTLLGVTGSHDLSGGNRIEFQFEAGTSLEDGSQAFGPGTFVWNRNANAGFAGRWGSVRVGYELTPFLLDMGGIDPQGLSQAGSALAYYLQGLGLTGIFDNRMIQYRSPDLAGLKLNAGFGTGKVPGSTSQGNEFQATASYAIAGLNLAAGYLILNDRASSGKAAQSFYGGAGYNFKMVTIRGMAHDIKTADGAVHTFYWGAGVEVALADFKIKYGFYDYKDKDVTANKSKMNTLALFYAIEKSTNAYVGWTMVDNDGAVRVPPLYGSSWSGPVPVDQATSAVYVGFNYLF
jgi:predicted porin